MVYSDTVDNVMRDITNIANMGSSIFLFLNLKLIEFEIRFNPRIMKYATDGAMSKKYRLSLITKMLLKMKNAMNHDKNIM